MKSLLQLSNFSKGARFLRRLYVQGTQARQISGKSLPAQAWEQLRLYLTIALTDSEYYQYEFYTNKFSWQQKKQFISRKKHREITPLLDPPAYSMLTVDKLLFRRFFSNAGFPLPEFYGVFDREIGFIEGGGSLKTKEDLELFLSMPEVEAPVFKPLTGLMGIGILVFRCRIPNKKNVFLHVNGEEYDIEKIYRHLTKEHQVTYGGYDMKVSSGSYLIEKRIQQHPLFDEFNPHTLNTIRLVTLRKPNGKVEILGSYWRLAVGSQGIDNLNLGNICVAITDFENGTIGLGRLQVGIEQKFFSAHPKSALKFTGMKIPYWKEIRNLATRAAMIIPSSRSIGWDFAIGLDHPILIEGNEDWGERAVQISLGYGILPFLKQCL